jgi:hypothetical protein
MDHRRSVLRRVVAEPRAWAEFLAAARALKGLDPAGARRVLEARGLIGPEEVVTGPRARLLRRLMGRLGLDAAQIERADPALLRDLEGVCEGCDRRERCEHDHETGLARATYQACCPNAAKLDALRFAKLDAASA